MTFGGCTNFTGRGLEKWKTESMSNCDSMFYGCSHFNADISSWNVSRLQGASNMFMGCERFSKDLSSWKLTECRWHPNMFYGCSCVNFDVSNILMNERSYTLDKMFYMCASFEGKGLENWDMSHITRMNETFYNCYKLNVDLSHWDVRNVHSAISIFEGCRSLDFDASKMNFGIKKKGDSYKMFKDSGIKKEKQWKFV